MGEGRATDCQNGRLNFGNRCQGHDDSSENRCQTKAQTRKFLGVGGGDDGHFSHLPPRQKPFAQAGSGTNLVDQARVRVVFCRINAIRLPMQRQCAVKIILADHRMGAQNIHKPPVPRLMQRQRLHHVIRRHPPFAQQQLRKSRHRACWRLHKMRAVNRAQDRHQFPLWIGAGCGKKR